MYNISSPYTAQSNTGGSGETLCKHMYVRDLCMNMVLDTSTMEVTMLAITLGNEDLYVYIKANHLWHRVKVTLINILIF